MIKLLIRIIFLASLLFKFVSCASPIQEVYKMDDQDRPSWASEGMSFIKEGDRISFVGLYSTRASSDLNLNMARKISEMKAWEELSKHVKGEFQSETQLAANGLTSDEEIETSSKLSTKALIRKARVRGRWYRILRRESETGDFFEIQYFTKISLKRKELNDIFAGM